MDISLKPCPHCGSDETTIAFGPTYGKMVGKCQKCGDNGPERDTDVAAAEAYNKRADGEAEKKAKVKHKLQAGCRVSRYGATKIVVAVSRTAVYWEKDDGIGGWTFLTEIKAALARGDATIIEPASIEPGDYVERDSDGARGFVRDKGFISLIGSASFVEGSNINPADWTILMKGKPAK